MTPIERAGKALGLKLLQFGIDDLEDSELRSLAKAAIAAMMEPSEAMIDKAQEAYEPDYEYGISDDDMKAALVAAIQAAIDE